MRLNIEILILAQRVRRDLRSVISRNQTVMVIAINYKRILKTQRLNIRALESGDGPRIFDAYGNDPDVARYMAWQWTGRLADTQEYVDLAAAVWEDEFASSPHYGYAIELNENQELIGAIGFEPRGFHAIVGYNLAKKHWRKGFASEALSALTDYLLSLAPIFRVSAIHDIENPASGNVLERCGFEREGIAKRISIHPNICADPRDCVVWAKTR